MFVEPHPNVTDGIERRQARTLSAIHLPLIIVSSYMLIWPEHGFVTTWESSYYVNIALFAGMCGTYVMSRTSYYKLSALSLVILQVVYVFSFLLLQPDQNAVEMLPFMLSLPIFFSAIFLNLAWTAVLCVVVFTGLLVTPALNPAVPLSIMSNHLHYLGVLSPVMLLVSYLRTQDQRKARHQSLALEESNARYQSLFEASFEPIIIHDNGVILDMNPAAEAMTGYRLAEVRHLNLVLLVPLHLRQEFQAAIAVDPDTTGRYETTLLRKDGSSFPAEVRAKHHSYHGRSVRVVSFRDQTLQHEDQRKTIELTLAQAQREILQKLIRNFSHDFRTPLAVIKTSLYLIERSLTQPEKHQKHVALVHSQVEKLQEIVDDVILLSKLDNAQFDDFEFAPIDIDWLLNKLVEDWRLLAETRGLKLEYTSQCGAEPLYGDVTALERVLKSLIVNAINFTPENGTVTLLATISEDEICLAVSDTGIGIAEPDLPHVFEHFFRGDPVRNTETGGAGLGLTVAQKLVNMHQGKLLVESNVGEGSTFTIVLPRMSKRETPLKMVSNG
ncbi:MAG: PAS domain S-box protein [Anaerolineae bacterium]|nr:PAS domain S-box protein [Anaerolineae bacterium]